MRQVPAHYEDQQIIRTRLSSDAGKFPLLFVYTFFCNLRIGEKQSQEAARTGKHEAPSKHFHVAPQRQGDREAAWPCFF